VSTRASRETKDLHAEEERAASVKKKKKEAYDQNELLEG
jgi:hypothetical protein